MNKLCIQNNVERGERIPVAFLGHGTVIKFTVPRVFYPYCRRIGAVLWEIEE